MVRLPSAVAAFPAGAVLSICVGLLLLTSCQSEPPPAQAIGYEVVETYPHDPEAFTQGLVMVDSNLYESTGLRGKSTLRQVDLTTGKVTRWRPLAPNLFGEGLAAHGDHLFQLTWTAGKCLVYHQGDLSKHTTVDYDGEGWGLTSDGQHLIMSDGSARLQFLDPKDFTPLRSVTVTDAGAPVLNLNELEWIDGAIYSNVWQSNTIVRIDPATGRVTGRLDLARLMLPRPANPDAVLNGIAWDSQNQRLLVTGKLWPKLFALRLLAE